MNVAQYMTREVVTANPKDGLRQTFFRMRERGIRHMPVLDEHEKLIGIISDRDLRRPDWIDEEENVAHYYLLDDDKKVDATMTKEPVALKPHDEMRDAVRAFLRHGFGAMPVIDESRHLVGILSVYDVLRAFDDLCRD